LVPVCEWPERTVVVLPGENEPQETARRLRAAPIKDYPVHDGELRGFGIGPRGQAFVAGEDDSGSPPVAPFASTRRSILPHVGTAGHKPMLPARLRQSSRVSGSGLGYDIVAALNELNDH
jgi:hypothetical protein